MHVYSPDCRTYEAFVSIFYLGSPAGTGLLGRSPEGPPAPLGPSLSAASNLNPQRPGGQNSALTGGRGPGTCRRVWAARRHARLWFRGPWPGGALHGKAGHRTRRPRHPAAAPLAWTDHEWRGGGRSRSGLRGSPTRPRLRGPHPWSRFACRRPLQGPADTRGRPQWLGLHQRQPHRKCPRRPPPSRGPGRARAVSGESEPHPPRAQAGHWSRKGASSIQVTSLNGVTTLNGAKSQWRDQSQRGN